MKNNPYSQPTTQTAATEAETLADLLSDAENNLKRIQYLAYEVAQLYPVLVARLEAQKK